MNCLAAIVRKCRSMLSFPVSDWLLMPATFIALGLARAAILVLPFRTYSLVLGQKIELGSAPPPLSQQQLIRAKRIGRLVQAVARITPWESLCLPQAMVAAAMMRSFRIPQVTYLGVAKTTDKQTAEPLLAHAWVMADDMVLTGSQGHTRFTVVATLISGN